MSCPPIGRRGKALALLGSAAALCAACTYSPEPQSGALRCSEDNECPSGYRCAEIGGKEACWKGGAGGASGTGGRTGTGGRGAGGAGGCADSCRFSLDGFCDEPSADCPLGTDCTDCYSTLCTNSCRTPRDGFCDEPILCPLGTDCADCHPSGVAACTDTCLFANDDACDEPDLCPPNTDCSDCRPTTCRNTCASPADGVCDVPALCYPNTDCTDCGGAAAASAGAP
jgi:hypothetical protein